MFTRSYYLAASLCFLICVQLVIGQAVGLDIHRGSQNTPSVQSTCPYRSVNYIIETLPQQCLKTPWSTLTYHATSTSAASNISPDSPTAREPYPTDPKIVKVTAEAITQSPSSQIPLNNTTALNKHENSSHASAIVPEASATTMASLAPEATPQRASDTEGESPLDNANFLSFEEWKKQNLAKAGQSTEHIGGGRAGVGGDGSRRRPGNINNALDSLGEDTELEIDFGGFVNPVPSAQPVPPNDVEARDEASRGGKTHDPNIGKLHPRGKDAGKTCKERSNYASFDCAATIMKTNREGKGATSILVENKDSYMLNECSAKNKFFIVELCDDILIDTVVLANFEFFSSIFRTFKISVSDRYPVKLDKWRDLGTFEARNSREVQAFLIETPQIWARYLRVEVLTHYGNEYYCPISLLRVHGTTMMEEFNHDLKASREEEDAENEVEAAEEVEVSQDVVIAVRLKEEASKASQSDADARNTPLISSGLLLPASPTGEDQFTSTRVLESTTTATAYLLPPHTDLSFLFNGTLGIVCLVEDTPQESIRKRPLTSQSSISYVVEEVGKTVAQQVTTTASLSSPESSSVQTVWSVSAAASPTLPAPQSSSDTESLSSRTDTGQSLNNDVRGSPSTSPLPRSASSSTQPHAANPTTQESFFKSVHKRLQLLESNSTLSLQYIEEQSRILRDAFSKVEKRQLAKATAFFETLNTTVLTEMRDFRSQYDQLWQSTVLELSSQRTQNQQEILALSKRLTLLADEVVLQRRIAIMQFLLIVVCLGLVLFGRSPSQVATYLEMPPIVQNAINKSTTNLSRYSQHYDYRNRSPSPTRPSSRYGILGRMSPSHFRGPSEESRAPPSEGRESPDVGYLPPTPTSQEHDDLVRTHVATEDPLDKSMVNGNLEPEAAEQRKIKSGPSTPSGSREEENKKLKGQPYLRPG